MENIVEVMNLTVRRSGKVLFDSVSFTLEAGKLYFFRGVNGSGKSTLFELLSGNLEIKNQQNNQGQIYFFDKQYTLRSIKEIRNKICYIPQQVIFDDYITVKEFFSLPFDYNIVNLPAGETLGGYIERYIADNRLDAATECRNTKDLLKKRIAKMSLGQQHIISIFGGLIGRENTSMLYLFDEPLNYLDYNNSVLVLNKINQIHITNKLATMATCSHCQSVQNIDVAYQIKENRIEPMQYHSYTCFGKPDQNGYISTAQK